MYIAQWGLEFIVRMFRMFPFHTVLFILCVIGIILTFSDGWKKFTDRHMKIAYCCALFALVLAADMSVGMYLDIKTQRREADKVFAAYDAGDISIDEMHEQIIEVHAKSVFERGKR